MDDSTTKCCARCGASLPLAAFGKNRTTPDGLQRWCRACRTAHASDPARKAAKVVYDERRRNEQRDALRAQARERYHNDPEYRERRLAEGRARSHSPAYRERERQRHYRRWADPAYREMRVAKHRERRHRDPFYRRKLNDWRRLRKARAEAQGPPFSPAEWFALCERYDHRCLACGERKPLTPDHIVPLSRGGSGAIENIQPLCLDCNRRKSARTIDYRPA